MSRYTLTYTPDADPILPTPAELHVKIKNTSAVPLRAAYLHGPYTLYTACYPSSFSPDHKHELDDGLPQFEPNLKAGGSWDAVISIPERLRQTPESLVSVTPPEIPEANESITWVIEITSQVIFSTTAAVHFELLIGRDEQSLNMGTGSRGGISTNVPLPAQIEDHWKLGVKGHHSTANSRKGVYSRSITMLVDDTASLWNAPAFPSWEEKQNFGKDENAQDTQGDEGMKHDDTSNQDRNKRKRKKRRVHFVVVTHGLHSNLGADMLYLKESIDAASKRATQQAREDRNRRRRNQYTNGATSTSVPDEESAHTTVEEDSGESDNEQVIVRGFPGNAVRTERGIQYLGKRLAKYVLLMTYPDQPYLPVKKPKKSISRSLTGLKSPAVSTDQSPAAEASRLSSSKELPEYAYEITSISFIGHSLGGLIQTYAIAYIQKYSPGFFDRIKPINFIALATPFLGLSNENPMYVRFALDFGLVGRTGQDLGLSWTAPKVRSGWGAVIGGLGNESKKPEKQSDPGSKPLLRILPSGPAHQVLLKFRNRTVYSNVVNDGIVPLRTSCLLFLDWRGLDRVEKARRENGLVGTMAEWGWAELTGANSNPVQTSRSPTELCLDRETESQSSSSRIELVVATDKAKENSTAGDGLLSPVPRQFLEQPVHTDDPNEFSRSKENSLSTPSTPSTPSSPFGNLLSMFRPKLSKDLSTNKDVKIYKRSQTVNISGEHTDVLPSNSSHHPRPALVRGDSLYEEDGVYAPPKTTFFESAGDVLRPPLPPTEFLLDPASRPRTIFHDRVYHPEDIPPPSPVKRRTTIFSSSNGTHSGSHSGTSQLSDHESKKHTEGSMSGMKVEEKIARAYHRDLSWRKVLVRLEPDAHNNIIVRRMFANAYGWPVVKHLVDTHFGYTIAAQTDDVLEPSVERARPVNETVSNSGEEVEGQTDAPPPMSVAAIEQTGSVGGSGSSCPSDVKYGSLSEHGQQPATLPGPTIGQSVAYDGTSDLLSFSRQDSARWSDRYFGEGDNESGSEAESSDRSYHDNLSQYRHREPSVTNDVQGSS